MADYLELFSLASDSDLQDRIAVAITIEAQAILSTIPTPDAAHVQWASSSMSNTQNMAKNVLKMVLAANKSLAVAQIQGASDAAIQANVNELIEALVLAGG
jgi:hypothetical protein